MPESRRNSVFPPPREWLLIIREASRSAFGIASLSILTLGAVALGLFANTDAIYKLAAFLVIAIGLVGITLVALVQKHRLDTLTAGSASSRSSEGQHSERSPKPRFNPLVWVLFIFGPAAILLLVNLYRPIAVQVGPPANKSLPRAGANLSAHWSQTRPPQLQNSAGIEFVIRVESIDNGFTSLEVNVTNSDAASYDGAWVEIYDPHTGRPPRASGLGYVVVGALPAMSTSTFVVAVRGTLGKVGSQLSTNDQSAWRASANSSRPPHELLDRG